MPNPFCFFTTSEHEGSRVPPIILSVARNQGMQKISITNIKPKERSILKRFKHKKQKDSLREEGLKKKSRIPNPWRKILPSDMILAQGKEALDHPVPENMRYL